MTPLQKAISLVDESIEVIKRGSNQDIKIEQKLSMKQIGSKNTAHQGNIIINLVNQTVLINLYELRQTLSTMAESDFLPTLNIKELTATACKKALEMSNGEFQSAGRLLGVSGHSVGNWVRGNGKYRKLTTISTQKGK